MVDIPPKFEFEHLMSHTFPGFFSAVTLFMLIDVWSPLNLTALAIKDAAALTSFVGFVLLIGSILGIIIDGIFHSIIEDDLFDQIYEVKKYKIYIKGLCFGDFKTIVNDEKSDTAKILSHHYFIKKLEGEKAINIYQNIINSYYCYARFYSNTFLALLPFSLIVPSYLLKTLLISWNLCIFIGIASLILACFCLYSGYVAYKMYNRALFSAIYGYTKDSEGDGISDKKNIGGKIKGNVKTSIELDFNGTIEVKN